MGNELDAHLALEILTVDSGPAATVLAIVNVPVGEVWKITEVDVYHDDPAGASLEWRVVGEAGQTLTLPLGATAINTHVKLSDSYALPFWAGPEWLVYIAASGALAAGKKFYGAYHATKIRGVPAGTYR